MSVLTLHPGVVNKSGELDDSWTGHFASAYLRHISSTWQPGQYTDEGKFVNLKLAVVHPTLLLMTDVYRNEPSAHSFSTVRNRSI